jgi:hypothetical protein
VVETSIATFSRGGEAFVSENISYRTGFRGGRRSLAPGDARPMFRRVP